MYACLLNCGMKNRCVLVIECRPEDDAPRLATTSSTEHAVLPFNKTSSHSLSNRTRRSTLVEWDLDPTLRGSISGAEESYVRRDAKNLAEPENKRILAPLQAPQFSWHVDFLVLSVVPDRFERFVKLDRLRLRILHRFGHLRAALVLLGAPVFKPATGSVA